MKNNSLSMRHFSFEKVGIWKTEIGFQEKDPILFFVTFYLEKRKLKIGSPLSFSDRDIMSFTKMGKTLYPKRYFFFE